MEDVHNQIDKLRYMKENGVIMETDPDALCEINILQDLLRSIIPDIYGSPPYHIEMCIEFPECMNHDNSDPFDTITFELPPIQLLPYSVFYFFEYVLKHFKKGNFKRNASHVLQAKLEMGENILPFAFQEYHPDYSHKEYTIGYAGRPSTAGHIYISTRDNSRNHGPGTQGSKTEADGMVGTIIGGEHDLEVVKRMRTQPGASEKNGFVHDPNFFIEIHSMTLLPN
uniref:Uncharacterized protein n=1 Tax=viral metagenome TaxID=1070528 RepID=A0A6C0CLY8_9ZZZZ